MIVVKLPVFAVVIVGVVVVIVWVVVDVVEAVTVVLKAIVVVAAPRNIKTINMQRINDIDIRDNIGTIK